MHKLSKRVWNFGCPKELCSKNAHKTIYEYNLYYLRGSSALIVKAVNCRKLYENLYVQYDAY